MALQGAFLDHYRILKSLGATVIEVRSVSHIFQMDRLIIPGGESTVMKKYLHEFNLTGAIINRIVQGMPVWGICAGCILLARTIDQSEGPLNVMNIAVRRNAYGRQMQSSVHSLAIPLLQCTAFPAPFIRAPRIVETDPSVNIHAHYENDPVFVQQDKIMATTFHPELTQNPLLHDYFLKL